MKENRREYNFCRQMLFSCHWRYFWALFLRRDSKLCDAELISKNITSWMFLHLAIWVCRAKELGQIEIIPYLQDGIVHVWDSWLEKMNASRQRCLLTHPPTAFFDLASDIRTKENSCICTNLSVCPAKYNKMLIIRGAWGNLFDVQNARNTLH